MHQNLTSNYYPNIFDGQIADFVLTLEHREHILIEMTAVEFEELKSQCERWINLPHWLFEYTHEMDMM